MADKTVEDERITIELVKYFLSVRPLIAKLDAIDADTFQSQGLRASKVISEILLFFELAESVVTRAGQLRDRVVAFVSWAVHEVCTEAFIANAERRPAEASRFGIILLCARRYGVCSPMLARVEALIRSPGYFAVERLPFRHHEATWLYERVTNVAVAEHLVCRSSLLSRFTHPSMMARTDLYAKTHSAMFETDFGRRRSEHCAIFPDVAIALDHDLAYTFCDADWDLVGEICLTQVFLECRGPTFQQADAALRSIYKKFGFIPSITFDSKTANSLPEQDDDLYRFIHSYHTTLVFGLLIVCAANAIPARIENSDIEPASGNVLAAIVEKFGVSELDYGPMNEDWFSDDFEMGLDMLIDGYATRCYVSHGLGDARALLEQCAEHAGPLARDSHAFYARF